MIKQICYLFVLFLSSSSCDWINPEEPLPAYLIIETPTFSSRPGEGSSDTRISEYWVFLDDTFLGVFPIPATIPVLHQGTATLRVQAGIRVDGRAATPDIYPFYTTYQQNISLGPLSNLTIQPEFQYLTDAQFAFVEDFERNTTIFRDLITGTSQSRIRISNENVFEGQGCGLIQLSTSDAYMEIATVSRYQDLLARGNSVFLEMNYRSDVPVSFGILGYELGQTEPLELTYRAGFNPSAVWNKIYFDLTPIIAGSPSEQFKIIMQAALPLDAQNNFELDAAQVYLDNLKLVHF